MPRILIIDDEELVRRSLAMILRTQGWATELAEGGSDGLAKARQHPPDLILCDVTMPFMNGMVTLAEIRRDPLLRCIPVLMVTGRMGDETERQAREAGAQALLLKPFSNEELLQLVRAHLKAVPHDNPPGPPSVPAGC
jgi:CheY-like chemotaxis protein